ncbi:hypothetical protein EV715DRAFT_289527 [Schizophyllum commune]
MPSHPFFTAVDQDTRARRVYEFGVNTRAWLVEYRARHPHAPVDEARMQKRHDRAAREEMEERARMRPAPGGVDPVVTLTSVANSEHELQYLLRRFTEWVVAETANDKRGGYYQN